MKPDIASDEPRYSLADAELLIGRWKCFLDGHQFADDRPLFAANVGFPRMRAILTTVDGPNNLRCIHCDVVVLLTYPALGQSDEPA